MISREIGASPHGAAMLAAALGQRGDMNTGSAWQISKVCSSPKFVQTLGVEYLCDETNKSVAHGVLVSRRGTPELAQALASRILGEWEDCPPSGRGTSLDYLVLANPDIGADLFERFARFFPQLSGERKGALFANPLYRRHKHTWNDPATDNAGFLAGAASFGNLNDPAISTALLDSMRSTLNTSKPLRSLSTVLRRPDLTRDFIQSLDSQPMTAEQYSWLVEFPEHQKMVKDAILVGDREFKSPESLIAGQFVISQSKSVGTCAGLYYRAIELENNSDAAPGTRNLLAASALCGKNSGPTAFEHAWKRRNPALLDPIMARSPFAAELLERNMKDPLNAAPFALAAQCPDSTPDVLLHALGSIRHAVNFRANHYLKLLGHKNFPWDKTDVQDIYPRDEAGAAEYLSFMGGVIIGCVRSRAFSEKVAASAPDAVPSRALAAIFTESASSRRLNKEIAEEPYFANLAACHPNGVDIKTSAANPDVVAFIAGVRNRQHSPALSGRSGRATLTGNSLGAYSHLDI